MNPRTSRAPATKAVLIAIFLGFAVEVLTGAWKDGRILSAMGAIHPMAELRVTGQYWRLVTAMFLHGDGTVGGTLLHLFVNVWVIFQLGTLYELMFGTRRFLIVYFVSGIIASITSAMHIDGSSVGASGAIFGLLGAFIFSVMRSPRWRHERAARSIVKQVVFLTIANILILSQFPQIDNAAHLGGLVTGLILGVLLPHHQPPLPPSQVIVDVSAPPRDEP